MNIFHQENKLNTIKGFTLIELMVVIAIVGLLSSISFASLNILRTKAEINKAKVEMNQINTAMQMYLNTTGSLPPGVDNCSACSNPCNSSWKTVMNSLVNAKDIPSAIYKDPWGNYYCYDNNYKVPDCSLDSVFWSMGPNGNRDTSWGNGPPATFAGDDIGSIIEAPHC